MSVPSSGHLQMHQQSPCLQTNQQRRTATAGSEGRGWREGSGHICAVSLSLSANQFSLSLYTIVFQLYTLYWRSSQMNHSLQSKKSQIALLFYCFPEEHLKHFPLQTLWSLTHFTDSHNCAIFSLLNRSYFA